MLVSQLPELFFIGVKLALFLRGCPGCCHREPRVDLCLNEIQSFPVKLLRISSR